jgi:hypothetical protein
MSTVLQLLTAALVLTVMAGAERLPLYLVLGIIGTIWLNYG